MIRLTPARHTSDGWLLPLVVMVIWCLVAPLVFAAPMTGVDAPAGLLSAPVISEVTDSRITDVRNTGPAGDFRILAVSPVGKGCGALMQVRVDRERTVEVELLGQDGARLARVGAGRLQAGTHELRLPRSGGWGQLLTARLRSEGETRSLKLLMLE